MRDRLIEAAGVERCAQVTSGHLVRVRRLDLSGAFLFALREDDLRGLTRLETLDLSRNRLWTLPEEAFRGLRALKVLRLEDNLINRLPEEVFRGLDALKVLRLEDNRMVDFLRNLPRGIFDDVLDTLEELRVDPFLKATIDFTATAQQAVAGDWVTVEASLNRGPSSTRIYSGLPVALRIPFSVGGTAGAEDFESPPHPSSGELLFEAGMGRTLVVFRLSESVRAGTTIVVRLGEPSEAGLRRSDGTGPDAPFLRTASLLERDAERAVHRVTVVEPVPADVCSRTPQVRDALMEAIRSSPRRIDGCADVTTADLTQVTGLYLKGAGIRSLQPHDFRGLTSLELLDLLGNRLSALPEGIFRGLSNLEALLLNVNALTGLPPGVFEGLESLRWLTLDDNRLESLPEDVFRGLTKLEWLAIRHNRLTTLPEGVFDGLVSVTDLGLDGNQLSELPEGVFAGMHSLEAIGLDGNRLSQLPEGIFSQLKRLRQVSLIGNQLSELPAGLFRGLEDLELVWLGSNLLATLPEGVFAGLSSLRILLLHRNSLTSLPEGVFGGLESLERLWLFNNRLATLPAGGFRDLRGLRVLFIDGNQLTSLPAGVFEGLDNLAWLSLQRNQLNALPAGVFDDVLDTLGGDFYIDYFGVRRGRLEIGPRLKAGLGFASPRQRVPDGAAVRVPGQLSRELPVGVRVPYTLGIGGGGGGLSGLSPAPGGLLFRAGETRRDISFTLVEDAEAPGERSVALSLGGPAEIGLHRSDGSGPPAPYLKPESLLSFGEATHTVTVVGADPEDREPFCLSLWEGAPCSAPAVFPHVLLGPLGESRATAEILLANRDPGPAACQAALLFHRGTSQAPPVSFDGRFPEGNLIDATLPRGGASVVTLAAPDAEDSLAGAVSLFTRSPCTGDSLHVEGRTLLKGEADGEIEEMFSLEAQSRQDWLADGECGMLVGVFGNGREERVVVVGAEPGGAAPAGTRLEARAFDLEGNFTGRLAGLEVTGSHQVLPRWNLSRPTIVELCLDAPGESGFRLAATAVGSKAGGSGAQYYSESLSSEP